MIQVENYIGGKFVTLSDDFDDISPLISRLSQRFLELKMSMTLLRLQSRHSQNGEH